MNPISTSDLRHLNAAEGWIGLGAYTEAENEIAQVAADLQAEPEVLQLRSVICLHTQNWPAAIEIGEALVRLLPKNPFGWINRSYALRRAPNAGLQAAYDALLPAVKQVTEMEQVTFNLACYSCQLGELEEATQWLQQCFAAAEARGKLKTRKEEALDEADLEPLWGHIRTGSWPAPS